MLGVNYLVGSETTRFGRVYCLGQCELEADVAVEVKFMVCV